MIATIDQVRAQFPYLSDAPEWVLDQYREGEARRTVVLTSLECTECGADAYAEGLCHLCRLEMEKRS